MKLNLGCGQLALDGWTGVDIIPGPTVDVVHDLDSFPWPWGDESATAILAHDIYEHVNDPLGFMAECWRVLQPGGELSIKTTHRDGPSSYDDPTHKRFLTERSFDYWIPGTVLHERYGPQYARGAAFKPRLIEKSGDLLVAELVRL